jgi:hypothetical protein
MPENGGGYQRRDQHSWDVLPIFNPFIYRPKVWMSFLKIDDSYVCRIEIVLLLILL